MIDENSDIDDDVNFILKKVMSSRAGFEKASEKYSVSSHLLLQAHALAELANQAAYANILRALELMILMEDGDDDDEDDE